MKIDENILIERAKMVVYVISVYSRHFEDTLYGKVKGVKPIKEVIDTNDEEKGKILYLTMISFLFQAQKFFWERVVDNEEESREFEKHIFEVFTKITERDPKPYITDIGEYIKTRDETAQMMYLGSRICELLNKKDAILMTEINITFASLLKYGFFDSLKRVWKDEFVAEK